MASGNPRKRRTPKTAQAPGDSWPPASGEQANPPASSSPSSGGVVPPPPPGGLGVHGDAATPVGAEPPRMVTPAASSPPATPAADVDPLIAKFISQAGSVIAVERGINARSRMKLGVIAEEIGLSEQQFADAMARLQGKSPEEEISPEDARRLRRRRRAFHDMVGQSLMQLPQGMLTSATQRQLVGAGSDYGLTEEESQAEVAALASKLRVRTISSEEAQRHIRDLAAMAATAGRIAAPQHARLVAEGQQWGLTSEQVDTIVDDVMRGTREKLRTEHFRTVALVTGAAVVLVGVLGVVAWLALMSSFTRDHATTADGSGTTRTIPSLDAPADSTDSPDGDTTAVADKPLPVPSWWDSDLATAVVNVKLRLPTLASHLPQLRSPDAATRSAAYVDLVEEAGKSAANDEHITHVGRLLAGAYALDPADQSATAIREQITQLAAGPPDSKPNSYGPYARALWAAKTGFLALTHDGGSDQRRAELATALGRALQTTIDPNAAFLDLNHTIMQAACIQLYDTLAATAHHAPNITVSLHKQLKSDTAPYFTTEQADRAETEYLLAILPELGERWQLYEDLLRRCVQSDDPINTLKLLEVFERTSQRSLQNFLAGQLILRSGLRDERRSPSELAAAVRGELGAADLPIAGDSRARYRTWRRMVNDQFLQAAAAPEEPAKLLEQTLRMAHLSTMGHALALQDVGQPEFEELSRAGLPALAVRAEAPSGVGPPSRTPREVSSNTQRQVDRLVKTIGNYKRLEGVQRIQAIRSLSGFTRVVDDLSPTQAGTLAGYMADKKTVGEHVQVMAAMGEMMKWNNLKLALADELDDATLRPENMAELLAKALGHDVEIDAAGKWRNRSQTELLQSVVNRLSEGGGEAVASAGDRLYDKAAATLSEKYRTQAKLAGAGLPGELATPGKLTTPGLLLPPLVQAWAGKVSPAATRVEDAAWLKALPETLAAEQFLATSDLAATVRHERLLLRLLALEVARRHSDRTEKANQIVAHVAAQDQRATHLLTQLREGQEGLLRMWILINEP